MKMYKTKEIIEILQDELEFDNEYVGFEQSEEGNLLITFKEHAPGWRDSDGFGEAVEEIELLESEGEY